MMSLGRYLILWPLSSHVGSKHHEAMFKKAIESTHVTVYFKVNLNPGTSVRYNSTSSLLASS